MQEIVDVKKLGSLIRAFRVSKGPQYSQSQLARDLEERVGRSAVKQFDISAVERGSYVSPGTIKKLQILVAYIEEEKKMSLNGSSPAPAQPLRETQAPVALLMEPAAKPPLQPILQIEPEDLKEFVRGWERPQSFFVEMTPELAQAALNIMGPNRKLSETRCDKFTRDGLNGDFIITNIGVGFNVRGETFDALHRLTAIVRTGLTQIMLIVVGLPVEAQGVIDNDNRTFADELHMNGEHHGALMSASLQWLYNFKISQPDQEKKPGEQKMRLQAATRSELRELLERHPSIRECCVASESIRSKVRRERIKQGFLRSEVFDLLPPSLNTAMFYVGSVLQKSPEDAKVFMEKIIRFPDGSALDEAPHAWAKYLYDKKTSNGRAGRMTKATGTIRAWNLFKNGTPVIKGKWQEVRFAAFQGLDYGRI